MTPEPDPVPDYRDELQGQAWAPLILSVLSHILQRNPTPEEIHEYMEDLEDELLELL